MSALEAAPPTLVEGRAFCSAWIATLRAAQSFSRALCSAGLVSEHPLSKALHSRQAGAPTRGRAPRRRRRRQRGGRRRRRPAPSTRWALRLSPRLNPVDTGGCARTWVGLGRVILTHSLMPSTAARQRRSRQATAVVAQSCVAEDHQRVRAILYQKIAGLSGISLTRPKAKPNPSTAMPNPASMAPLLWAQRPQTCALVCSSKRAFGLLKGGRWGSMPASSDLQSPGRRRWLTVPRLSCQRLLLLLLLLPLHVRNALHRRHAVSTVTH